MRISVFPLSLAVLVWQSGVYAATQELRSGQSLKSGDYIVSKSGKAYGLLQRDGNFCVYRGARPGAKPSEALYCTLDKGAGAGPFYAALQNDGNFCIYRGKEPKFASGFVACVPGRSLGPGRYAMRLDADANLTIAREQQGREPEVVWDRKATSTLGNALMEAVMSVAQATANGVAVAANATAGAATKAAEAAVEVTSGKKPR
jgi:hypothetical protein